MRRLIPLILAAAVAAGAAQPASASASTLEGASAVRDCHTWGYYPSVLISSARNMSCRKASKVIRRYMGSISRTFWTPGGFYCYRVSRWHLRRSVALHAGTAGVPPRIWRLMSSRLHRQPLEVTAGLRSSLLLPMAASMRSDRAGGDYGATATPVVPRRHSLGGRCGRPEPRQQARACLRHLRHRSPLGAAGRPVGLGHAAPRRPPPGTGPQRERRRGGRGASIGNLDGDRRLEIVVSTFDHGIDVFRVPRARPNRLPWPTGRGNLLRNGSGRAVGRR